MTSNPMHDDIDVSIVIASYNYGIFLPEALDSALHQKDVRLEVIVVDDGSTDNTKQVVEKYLVDKRVRYVYQENMGQAAAKNRGIRESCGKFIAFLDADDVWFDGKLKKQLRLFQDERVGVAYAKRVILDKDGKDKEFMHPDLYRGDVLNNMFIDNFICFSSAVVRAECFNEFGYFDETLRVGIDYDLWIRFSSKFLFDYVDEILVKYRIGHERLSSNIHRRTLNAFVVMNKNYKNPDIRRRLSIKTLLSAYSMTFCSLGISFYENKKYVKASGYYLISLAIHPFSARTWKQIVKLVLPRKALVTLKRLLAGA